MLRDEMELYTKLTGEDGTKVPIMKLGDYLDGYEKGRTDVIATLTQRWIPVKNRLPQKGEYGDVLVTFIPIAGTLWTTVMIARYSDLMGIAKPCFHIGEVGKESFENITPQVVAWMPLPEPYKEVEK